MGEKGQIVLTEEIQIIYDTPPRGALSFCTPFIMGGLTDLFLKNKVRERKTLSPYSGETYHTLP